MIFVVIMWRFLDIVGELKSLKGYYIDLFPFWLFVAMQTLELSPKE